MRIVHLSTSDCAGGAARAAFRLHEGLLGAGIASTMVVGKKKSALDSVSEIPVNDNVTRFWQWLEDFYLWRNRTEISNTYFSLGYPGVDLTKHPSILAADVIHLHWVAGFQSPMTLARLQNLGKPIVWSCHDEKAFTGGCHYTFGCPRFTSDCCRCPQLSEDPLQITAANLQDQKALLDASRVTILAPSRWMAETARKSGQFKQSRVEVIPYGLDTKTFVPLNREQARKQLGIPTDAFCLLFGADAISERRKGFHELMAALRVCAQEASFARKVREQKVVLLCFGRPDKSLKKFPVPVQSCGFIQSDEEMTRLYSASDLFVLPSLEDNLPNTMLEAMSCGTPVLGFDIGGLPDLVEHGVTGILVDKVDPNLLAKAILEALEHPARVAVMRPRCRAIIEAQFTLADQATHCLALYEHLLKDKRPSHSTPSSFALFGPEFGKRFAGLVSVCIERFAAIQPRWEFIAPSRSHAQAEAQRLQRILARFDESRFEHWSAEFMTELDAIAADRKRHKKRLSSRVKKILRLGQIQSLSGKSSK